MAESIYFSLSAYLNINLPLSQVHASVTVALLTWLSLEKAANAPTEKGIAKMWSKGLLPQMMFRFILPLKAA